MARIRLGVAVLLALVLGPAVAGVEHGNAQVGGAIALSAAGVMGPLGGGPTDLTHTRREMSYVTFTFSVAASRDVRTLECSVATGISGLLVRTRDNAAEGRGFIDAAVNAARGGGTLMTAVDQSAGPAQCEASLPVEGQFHRIGSSLVARLDVELRASDSGGTLVFEHTYCVEVVGTWIPIFPAFSNALVTVSGTGRVGGCPPGNILGRTVNDFNEHG